MPLNYRRGGVTYQINLYDLTVSDWEKTVKIYDGSSTKYIPADSDTGHANASHMRIRSGGTTYAVLKEKVESGLWSWGSAEYGELAIPDRIYRSSPTQVDSQANWAEIKAGNQISVALKNDGTMWSWGFNTGGGLGQGSTLASDMLSSPVQIGALTNWTDNYAIGSNHVLAIKSGQLWTWGLNNYGQQGMGDRTHRGSPVQVGTLTNWSKVACGSQHSVAIKTDGTLWAWGRGHHGELGHGTPAVHVSSPVQVGGLTTWSDIACGQYATFAIKNDGSLWVFGDNGYGQLGLGNTTDISSPQQVGSLTNWSKIHASTHVLAIKSDGSLWTWGYNFYGQQGLGDITYRSSPVRIGSANNWSDIKAMSLASLMINSSGNLYSCGYNFYGQLGHGDQVNRSSPTLIGSYPGWLALAGDLTDTEGHAHIALP